jgi:hypothetical protein
MCVAQIAIASSHGKEGETSMNDIEKITKDAERSLLLDMQSECIQLRVALAKARDQFRFYGAEHIAKAEGFEHKARNAFDRGDVMVSDNRAEDAVASRAKAKVNEEFAAMCQKAIDCRPATGSEDCPKLEALDTSGRQAVAAAMDRAGEVPDPVFATREPRSYVIGEGFKTVGDSDGFNGA